MTRPKHKITPFARLLIFLLIALPIIYIAASYINGEDGIENAKRLLGGEQTTSELIEEKEAKIQKLEAEILELKSDIKDLRKNGK